jgi:hypothetical protein
MISDLFKLFKQYKHSSKTPLEDFNTETFSGIMNLFTNVKDELIKNVFKLPPDNYNVSTQLKKDLKDDLNCIIDLVLDGDENLCFIENKVNSHEGDRQLERYSKILKSYYPHKKHFLFYCTKNSDPKNNNGEFNLFNFKQFRWYEIAKAIRPYSKQNPLIKNYLTFLTQHKMAQDNTIRIENLLSLNNLVKSLEIMEFYVENSVHDFSEFFKPALRSKSRMMGQIKNHNRICVYNEQPLLSSSNEWSEILYGISLENLSLFCQFFVNKNHQQYTDFYKVSKEQDIFEVEESEYGIALILKQDLGLYLNNENAETDIKNWFKNSFNHCKEFTLKFSTLKWNN